ncbi:class I SAM-dependent methyltransferase [Qingrenia yutianensis]|uniref:Class I SAM-dependent methyltransferase n=1 Tax=Qingrenia yutianensis TaxID=2763676 RepID=A0A926FAZ4_9FIRM|nr:class I SAM-dependent methyltransferase [Qingrenia yutianensis]MBC8595967.1 class I SAM-dependent methyltransferase [Qingrenia yutianensis]
MLLANEWSDYALIDCANGEKLEKWGSFTLVRPDPQIIWPQKQHKAEWEKCDAHYHRSKSGGGSWEYNKKLPGAWQIKYKNLTFNVKPMGFKHTGIFPEQAVNWDFIDEKIKNANRDIKVLNLFAYTGGATVAAAKAGASVVHVDAAKGMVLWAKENAVSSGLADAPIRYIVDDVIKFVCREIRRGNKYDAIIMDPPTYGRGPNGEVWKFEDELYPLIEKCMSLLSDNPLFMIVNSYTSNVSSTVVKNVLELSAKAKFGGYVTNDEIAIPVKNSGICLPCGAATRWISK